MATQPAARASGFAGFFRRPAVRFAGEAVAMCGVMCMGGIALSLAFFLGLGQSGLVKSAPPVAVLAVVVALSAPMAVYMWWRGHGLRHNLEMGAGTFGVGILVAIGLAMGIVSAANWGELFGAVCGPACAVMLIQMAVAYDMFSGSAPNHSGMRHA